MTNKIEFNMNIDKVIEVILFIIKELEDDESIDPDYVSMILYFADIYHLNKYGRPIVGDKYFSGPYGPVPYTCFKIISFDSNVCDNIKDELPFKRYYDYYLTSTRNVRHELLSCSDIETLTEICHNYSVYSKNYYQYSQSYLGWIYGFSKDFIDYEDLIYPENKEIKEHLLEFSREIIL